MSKAILQPVLPTFTEALVVALKVPDDSHLTDAGLKTEALKGRENFYSLHGKFFSRFLSNFRWKLLSKSL